MHQRKSKAIYVNVYTYVLNVFVHVCRCISLYTGTTSTVLLSYKHDNPVFYDKRNITFLLFLFKNGILTKYLTPFFFTGTFRQQENRTDVRE